ncbi:MAG: energy transducer TonB [Bacteroidota bacterium]
MRALVVTVSLLLSASALAQDAPPPPPPEEIVCDFVPGPVLIGSFVELAERVVYDRSPSPPPDGQVAVEFTVGPDGRTSDPLILAISDEALREPALRVVRAARFAWPSEIPEAERRRTHRLVAHFPPLPLFVEGAPEEPGE